ncbi:mesoderm induction early response protein 1 [Drosophila tropicalis]|uniref:mesoderm induction early response protein 1 n=1 Tax=Drosophila tropicalis TaxID=46794 RepID=UPI0035ABC4F3
MMAESSLQSASEASVDLDTSSLIANSELAMAGTREHTITPTKRERRKSPATSSDNTSTSVQAPMSPTSSMADTTFEPTIEMMVNDFDDEATLNEEEALALEEHNNPEDEIARLREESEMPIEELLAKYGGMAAESEISSTSSRNKPSTSKSSAGRRRRAKKQQQQLQQPHQQEEHQHQMELDNEDQELKLEPDVEVVPAILSAEQGKKQHRSHLMDLYPDESFDSSPLPNRQDDLETFTPLHTLLEEVEEPEEEEDTDTDSDDARKIIMVGTDYQADIPDGLSQYGDILPYENEDQLIWEPSQVTEREVEDYLNKIQEARILTAAALAEEGSGELAENEADPLPSLPVSSTDEKTASSSQKQSSRILSDSESVVKDNEQALHLLVQCGYDFKEALRRKRINILPLGDGGSSMGTWSEEECQKFEEGIHKFGKDFYQIRQNQVRTRTMRELVQFYYLWKKSERRDQSFILNDTIDHMDVFINETETGNGGNANGSLSPSNGHNSNCPDLLGGQEKERRKSYSIMTATGTNRKRRGSSTPLTLEDNENDNGNNGQNKVEPAETIEKI